MGGGALAATGGVVVFLPSNRLAVVTSMSPRLSQDASGGGGESVSSMLPMPSSSVLVAASRDPMLSQGSLASAGCVSGGAAGPLVVVWVMGWG